MQFTLTPRPLQELASDFVSPAIACFAAADVSFSVGILPVVWVIFAHYLIQSGARIEWLADRGGLVPWQTGGSFIALGVMLIYLGRRHYGMMLARAIGLGSAGRREEG